MDTIVSFQKVYIAKSTTMQSLISFFCPHCFSMPLDDPNNPDCRRELVGTKVILLLYRYNSYIVLGKGLFLFLASGGMMGASFPLFVLSDPRSRVS